jgi:hypothetical protein
MERWLGTVITVDKVEVAAMNEVLQVRLVYVVRARGERRFLNLTVTP